MGMTQVNTNQRNALASLRDEVERFVDAFLLDQAGVDTNVLESDATHERCRSGDPSADAQCAAAEAVGGEDRRAVAG